MSSSATASMPRDSAAGTAEAVSVDLKLEVVAVPVADVDRSKRFYAGLGWRLDADFAVGDQISGRAVHALRVRPARSISAGASPRRRPARPRVSISSSRTSRRRAPSSSPAAPRSARCSTVPVLASRPISGRDPERRSYASFATFADPDGNGWLLQEITTRFPAGSTRRPRASPREADLAAALRRAASAHGEHEKRSGGRHDENWPDWYAEYLVAEQSGERVPL